MLGGLAIAALLALAVRYSLDAVDGSDFGAYHAAGRAVLQGRDIYSTASGEGRSYLYPPPLAILIAPLALLPEPVAGVIWVALTMAGLLAAGCLVVGALRPRASREAKLLCGLAFLCVARPIDSELGNGQANYLVLLCVSLAVWLFMRNRRFQSGLALAAAAAFKVTPVVLCGYLLLKRQWIALAGVVAGLLLLLFVLPAVVWGPRKAIETDIDWARRHVAPFAKAEVAPVPTEEPARVMGYSLRAVVHRLLSRTVASTHYRRDVFVNVVDWPKERVDRIYKILALVFLAATALVCGLRPPSDGRFPVEISVWISAIVLVAPVTHKANLILLLIPFATALALALRGRARSVLPWVILSAACFNLTSSGFLGKVGSVHALAYGVLWLGMVVLWGGLAFKAARGTAVPLEDGGGPATACSAGGRR